MSLAEEAKQEWKADRYAQHAHFVPALGQPGLDLLKPAPGGRFAAEMGGHGCVAAITVAMMAALERRGIDCKRETPWYFPTVEDYRGRLERAGFSIGYIELIPRPTPLPTDMAGWLETFGA